MKKNTIKCPRCKQETTVSATRVMLMPDVSQSPVIFDDKGSWNIDYDKETESVVDDDGYEGDPIYTCDKCHDEISVRALNQAVLARKKMHRVKKSTAKTK